MAIRELGRICREWKPDIVHLYISKVAATRRLAME